MIKVELLLVVVSILLAVVAPNVSPGWLEVLEREFAKVARRRTLSIVVAGLAAILLRVALLPVLPVPSPSNPDEFSHLLAADTFVHGRLSNPTSPMWVHFESININQVPTYSSMMFPAQGLLLALGEKLLGHPFVGVLLSLGLMCSAICRMLQAYTPEPWALLGALLAAIRLGTFSYWANSYMGGAVAALGAALVLGAAARIRRSCRVGDSVLLGLGFGILANSRPFEGAFLCAAVTIWLLWGLAHKRSLTRADKLRVLLPLLFVMVSIGSAMLYYSWRTTGEPLRTPYLQNIQTYNPVPYFPWQGLKPAPIYRHAAMQDFYASLVGSYNLAREHPVYLAIIKGIRLWCFFLGPLLFLPIVIGGRAMLRSMARDKESLPLLLALVASLCASAMPIYFCPHYAAPLAPVVIALVLIAMRHTQQWRWRDKFPGVFLVRAIPCIAVGMLLVAVFSSSLGISMPESWPQHTAFWCSPVTPLKERADVLDTLAHANEQQLILVRYKPDHDVLREWVYNSADLDSAKVIWAREMNSAENEQLIQHFANRKVWLLEADEKPPRLEPFSAAAQLASRDSKR